MPPRTPWTNKAPDRQHSNPKRRNKDSPKSPQVLFLESLLDAVRSSSGKEKDPKDGCFCLARNHSLSAYTPICRECGLILCELNVPYYCCPFCQSPLLSAPARDALLVELEVKIQQTLADEEAARVAAAEKERQEAGAFPALGRNTRGAPPRTPPRTPAGGGTSARAPAPSGHKVLSLTANKVKVTTYSSPSTPPRSRSPVEEKEEEPQRVPRPPPEVNVTSATITSSSN